MTLSKIDPPLSRVTATDGVFVGGLMRRMGEEVIADSWPQPGLEPANSTARSIAAYYRRWQAVPFFPKSPWNAALGTYYLPGILPRVGRSLPPSPFNPQGSEILGLVPEGDVDRSLPAMPEYRMLLGKQRIGRRDLSQGEQFFFVGWPVAKMMAAVNAPAHQVVAYFAKHHDNPKLLGSPWCWARGLALPALEEPERNGKPLPLDQVRYRDAIAGELATVRPSVPITGPPVTTPSGSRSGVNRLPASALRNAGDQQE